MSNINTLICTFFGVEIHKAPTTNNPKQVIPHSICSTYLYKIINRQFVHVQGVKTVGPWKKKRSLSLWYLSWTVPRCKKLHDPPRDMNWNISTCSLALLLFYSASLFYKMMMWSLYPPYWGKEKLAGLNKASLHYLSQTNIKDALNERKFKLFSVFSW